MTPPVPLSRRILKDVEELMKEPMPGITVEQDDNNGRHLLCTITGPANSPYEGGQFKVDLVLPNDYPIDPPEVRFMTKVYHRSISLDGRICLDTLKNMWCPVFPIRLVLLSLQLLLAEPNDGPIMNYAVACAWRRNSAVAVRTATDWTRRYATPPPSASASSTTTENPEVSTTAISPTIGPSSADTAARAPSTANGTTAVPTPPEIVPDPNFFHYF